MCVFVFVCDIILYVKICIYKLKYLHAVASTYLDIYSNYIGKSGQPNLLLTL